MKKPIYYYINYPTCKHKNAKERMMAEAVEKYKNVIITPEAAEHLADWLEQYVREANIRYPRNRAYILMRNMRYGDTGPSFLAVSDGTDKYIVYISLNPVTDIIETQEDL